MPFIITGMGPDGPQSATRQSAASAIVLAAKWDEKGVHDVQITPPDRSPQCFKLIRAQHYRVENPSEITSDTVKPRVVSQQP